MSQSRARLAFLDAFRLLAALQMIQGHTLDALLARALRQGPLFRAWTFSRGLTSTAFLVTAGVAFALAHAAGSARGEPGAGAGRRLRRAGKLIALGYLLRAPFGLLFGDPPAAALRNLLAVDVLQCIGVSLLLLEGLYRAVPERRLSTLLSAALGTACFALAPRAEAGAAVGSFLLFTNYLSAAHGSLFPLLPAAGYVFWGGALAEAVLVGPRVAPRWHALVLFACGGVALLSALALFHALPETAARVSPAYAALKLGLVLCVMAGLAALFAHRQLAPALVRLSGETLFLYVSHVLVLYAGHVGLASLIGPTQSLASALLCALVLLISSSAGALGYGPALRALRARFARGTPRPQSSSLG